MTATEPRPDTSEASIPRFVAAGLLAGFGPWVLGMSWALLTTEKRWNVEGFGGFLFGLVYLAAFGAVAARVAGSYHITLGALAGEAFALGSLDNPGGLMGALIAIGAGMLGGGISRGITAETIGKGRNLHPPPPDAVTMLAATAGGVAAIVLLASAEQYGGVTIIATIIFLGAIVGLRRAGWPILTLLTASLGAILAIAGAAASVSDQFQDRDERPPLRRVLDLKRGDGMTFGEFVEARYARQIECPASKVRAHYSVLPQGPFKEPNGDLVTRYEVIFDGRGAGCRSTPGVFVAVFAEGRSGSGSPVLLPDCDAPGSGRFRFFGSEDCQPLISEILRAPRNGELAAVDWLRSFREGEAP